MNLEIERKFLVKEDYHEFLSKQATHVENINQGYFTLNSQKFRVRISTTVSKVNAYLTVKSKRDELVREEYESEINLEIAKLLMAGCDRKLSKVRTHFIFDNRTYVLDQFLDDKPPLIEVEFESEKEAHELLIKDLPPICAEEVTGDSKYSNYSLSEALSGKPLII